MGEEKKTERQKGGVDGKKDSLVIKWEPSGKSENWALAICHWWSFRKMREKRLISKIRKSLIEKGGKEENAGNLKWRDKATMCPEYESRVAPKKRNTVVDGFRKCARKSSHCFSDRSTCTAEPFFENQCFKIPTFPASLVFKTKESSYIGGRRSVLIVSLPWSVFCAKVLTQQVINSIIDLI